MRKSRNAGQIPDEESDRLVEQILKEDRALLGGATNPTHSSPTSNQS
jgi:hypothetical protein